MTELEIVLTQYVIYVNPADMPGKFVVREWHVVRDELLPVAGRAWPANTLEQARAMVPEGLVRLGRQEVDDPVILETWT